MRLAHLSGESTPSFIFQDSLLIGEIGNSGIDAAPHPGLGQVQGFQVVAVFAKHLARRLQYPHLFIGVSGERRICRLPKASFQQDHEVFLACNAGTAECALRNHARDGSLGTDLIALSCH